MKPITPDEAAELKEKLLPVNTVIEAFNECIAENWDGRTSVVKQTKVVNRIVDLFIKEGKTITSGEIFEKGFLDIEVAYERYGWAVDYNKPGYNEDYEPHWTFTKKV